LSCQRLTPPAELPEPELRRRIYQDEQSVFGAGCACLSRPTGWRVDVANMLAR
jgi:hypothetical protein